MKISIIILFVLVLSASVLFYFKPNNRSIIECVDYSLSYDYLAEENLKPYYDFPLRHRSHSKPVSEEKLKQSIEQPFKSGGFLKNTIIKSLNIGFLLDSLDKIKLKVTNISNIDRGDYVQKDFLFEDKNVGSFPVTLLIPKGNKDIYPAVLGLPGHGTAVTDFIDNYCAADLAKAGFVVAIPVLRAMMDFEVDYKVSKHLLLKGFTLMGIRVYESLLVVKYLNYLDFVDSSRIGIISHSGGSAVANLLVHIKEGFKSLVRDHQSSYMNNYQDIHCETIPNLHIFHPIINSTEMFTVPVLDVSYNFEGEKERIIDFLSENI
ncbi:MAG: hypothetical protein PHQ54_04970 [Candidatus Omnitrophica bacterium]|nr:hypothetical protein [Candidatus Omnitrophota bacterium]